VFRSSRKMDAFRDYLSPQVIGKLLRETEKEIHPPEVKHFQFVVIFVDDSNPQEEVAARINAVMRTLAQHRATISNITASVVVALFGVPFPEGDSAEARCELVKALLQEHVGRIRIAHGQCDGPVGLFGDKERSAYGAVIPGFSGILKKLLEIKLGTAVEIPQS
jgi:hypothetical protein